MCQIRTVLSGYLSLLVLTLAIISGCRKKQEINIGFLGTLTGSMSDLGTAGRDGAVLAVELANRQGGIHGHPIRLLEEDDEHDPQKAVAGFEKLCRSKVVAVVGPLTSSMSLEIVPVANRNKVVVIGPTISSPALSKKDDYFFRVYTSSDITSRLTAKAMWHRGIKRVALIFDMKNKAHTEGAAIPFQHEFQNLGGTVLTSETYTSGADVNFTAMAKRIAKTAPDGIFLLVSTMDTALICQSLKKENVKAFIACTDWSGTSDLPHFGGRAVEGLFFLHSSDKAAQNQAYLDFCAQFKKRFGIAPDFAAVRGFESANVLIEALRVNPDASHIRETLLKHKKFSGLQTAIEFDDFGDVNRKHFPFLIQNGRFVPTEL